MQIKSCVRIKGFGQLAVEHCAGLQGAEEGLKRGADAMRVFVGLRIFIMCHVNYSDDSWAYVEEDVELDFYVSHVSSWANE